MEESLDLYQFLQKHIELPEVDVNSYSPLTLAYIGDGIYELVIRTMVVNLANTSANKLHRKSSSLVKAQTQAELIMSLLESLTPEEERIYKRGRNAKSATVAKNASMSDYRTATGFEALMGYLYMTGQSVRMLELIQQGLKNIGKEIVTETGKE